MTVTFCEPNLRVTALARLIDAEFEEMPGMRLTEGQIRRLWSMTGAECQQALEYLCELGILIRDPAGRYMRRQLHH